MSNKRITDLTELTTPTTDDVFPVVDIATNTTQKVQLANLPVQTAVTTALATKQAILVSGTNIKTLNSVSLLGSGDIVLAATPSGVSGAIQFSNGSAFASDAANFFWDNTNKRLGIGTNAPTNTFEIASTSASPFKVATTAGYFRSSYKAGSSTGLIDYIDGTGFSFPTDNVVFGTSSGLGARVGIKGSGSTSATTSLLVQNSAGTEIMRMRDDGVTKFLGGAARIEATYIWMTSGQLDVPTIYNAGTMYLTPTGNVFGSASRIASALLQVDSTTQGFLPPRMTTTQINAIASPANGLEVYNTTLACPCFYDGTAWRKVSHTTM